MAPRPTTNVAPNFREHKAINPSAPSSKLRATGRSSEMHKPYINALSDESLLEILDRLPAKSSSAVLYLQKLSDGRNQHLIKQLRSLNNAPDLANKIKSVY